MVPSLWDCHRDVITRDISNSPHTVHAYEFLSIHDHCACTVIVVLIWDIPYAAYFICIYFSSEKVATATTCVHVPDTHQFWKTMHRSLTKNTGWERLGAHECCLVTRRLLELWIWLEFTDAHLICISRFLQWSSSVCTQIMALHLIV